MDTSNLERYLDSFGKYVVKQARTNLSKKKKNVSKGLYNSIKFKVVSSSDGLSIKFYMADYGGFIDKGVSGNKKKQKYNNWEGKSVKSPGKGFTNHGPPIDILSKWIKKKGIKPKGMGRGRSKNTGQYISGFAYLISKKIKREGIKSTSFFQRSLQLGFKKFDEKFLQALREDIIEGLTLVK